MIVHISRENIVFVNKAKWVGVRVAFGSCLSLIIKTWLPEAMYCKSISVNIFNIQMTKCCSSHIPSCTFHPVSSSAEFKPPEKQTWKECLSRLLVFVIYSGWLVPARRQVFMPSFAPDDPSACISFCVVFFYFSFTLSLLVFPLCSSVSLCLSVLHSSVSPTLFRSVSLPCRHSFILPSLCLPLAPCACTWLLAL